MISRSSELSGMRVWITLLGKPSRLTSAVNGEMNLEWVLEKEDNIIYNLGTPLVSVPRNFD